jgi:hypothetical protein
VPLRGPSARAVFGVRCSPGLYYEISASRGMGLAWSQDSVSYAGGSTATGRGSHAGQVKGDDPDKTGYLGPAGWGLGVGLTTSPCKTWICFETSTETSEK